jgi:hypothetical protein
MSAAGATRIVDVFNGDADGLCSLQQLRLATPAPEAELVTGAKRDIALLAHVTAAPGGRITVLDVSLARNRADLVRLLAAGAHVRYFDHHHAGEVPSHPHLETHLDLAADVCTAVIVDRHLGGRHRAWAVAGAFGDNMGATARALGNRLGLDAATLERLQLLGEVLNYNSYGDGAADLAIHPAELFRRIAPWADPLAFAAEEPIVDALARQRAADLEAAEDVAASVGDAGDCTVRVLPDAAWSRRVLGTFAHRLAGREPDRAHAVLKTNPDGTHDVSIRAPVNAPRGAGDLAARFGGGGRAGAGGIDALPPDRLDAFLSAFRSMDWYR